MPPLPRAGSLEAGGSVPGGGGETDDFLRLLRLFKRKAKACIFWLLKFRPLLIRWHSEA